MTSASITLRRPPATTVVGVAGFAAALAAASQVAVPIPGTPVPFTLQPLVVVLAGPWLGPVAGAASMLAHRAAGVHLFVPLDFVKAFIAALLAPRRAARGSA